MQRHLLRRNALIDQIAGTVLTRLSGMAARCIRDMDVRRNIDAAVMQIRARDSCRLSCQGGRVEGAGMHDVVPRPCRP